MVVVVAVILLAAPVFLLGGFVSRRVSADVQQRSEMDRVAAAKLAAALISTRIEAAGNSLQLLASRQSIVDALRARDGRPIQRPLLDMRTVFPNYSAAVAFDSQGKMLMADPLVPDQIGRDFSHRDYFIGAIKSPSPYLSEIFAAAAGPTPNAAAVSLAVRDGSEVIGLLLIGLSPAQVLLPLQPLVGRAGRELLVLDRTGRVIVSTDPARLPTAELRVPGMDFADVQEGSTKFRDGTTDRVATYTRIPVGNWTLVILDDPAVVFATEHRLEGAVLGASRIAGSAALVLGIAIATLYLALARQRRELAAGNAALQTSNRELAASEVALAATNAQLNAANQELEAFTESPRV